MAEGLGSYPSDDELDRMIRKKAGPPVNPETFSGAGHEVIEVFGVPSNRDVTIDSIHAELVSRLPGLDQSIGFETSAPVVDLPEANRRQIFIDQLSEFVTYRGGIGEFDDLSDIVVVREQMGGRAGKLIFLCVGTNRGKLISELEIDKHVDPSRLVEEQKIAFLRHLETENPGKVRTVVAEVDPDYMNWPYIREALYNAWFDGEISEKQLEKGQNLVLRLEQMCSTEKPYIAIANGQKREINIRDFIVHDEDNDRYYLNLIFVDREDTDEVKVG